MTDQQAQATIAILGSNTLAEHLLARLLEGRGYAARLLKAPPTGSPTVLPEGRSVDELLDGVDVVLLWPAPTLPSGAREAFLTCMRRNPATAQTPSLALSPTLEVGLQDELAVEVPLEHQFERLMCAIEGILTFRASSELAF